jgi:hypothetical protein
MLRVRPAMLVTVPTLAVFDASPCGAALGSGRYATRQTIVDKTGKSMLRCPVVLADGFPTAVVRQFFIIAFCASITNSSIFESNAVPSMSFARMTPAWSTR